MFGFYISYLMAVHVYTVEAQMKLIDQFKRKTPNDQ